MPLSMINRKKIIKWRRKKMDIISKTWFNDDDEDILSKRRQKNDCKNNEIYTTYMKILFFDRLEWMKKKKWNH